MLGRVPHEEPAVLLRRLAHAGSLWIALLLSAPLAEAETRPTVVELFTSQG